LPNINKVAVNKLVLMPNVSVVQAVWAQVQSHTWHIADHLWMASSYYAM